MGLGRRPNSFHGPSMRILIIDDEANIRKSLRIALEAMKHTVEESAGVADALQRIEQVRFDVAFLDLRLGATRGSTSWRHSLGSRPGWRS